MGRAAIKEFRTRVEGKFELEFLDASQKRKVNITGNWTWEAIGSTNLS